MNFINFVNFVNFIRLKILSAVILLVLVFVGCSSDINSENAIKKFNSAVDSFFNADSYTVSAKTNMNVSTENKTNSGAIEVSAEIKAKNDSNKNKIAEFNGIFNLNGQSEENGGYFKDGFFHNSEKYTSERNKVKVDYSEILTEGNINIFKLTDNSIVSEPVVKNVDDGISIDFDLNIPVVEQEIPEFISKLTYFLRVSEYDFAMNSCHINSIIDKAGNLKYCNFTIKAKNMLYDGTSDENFKSFNVDCDIDINIDISNINNTNFNIPDDLELYTDITPETTSESMLKKEQKQ